MQLSTDLKYGFNDEMKLGVASARSVEGMWASSSMRVVRMWRDRPATRL